MANDFLSVLLSFFCVSSLNRSLFSIADPCRPLDTLALDIDRTCNGASIVHTRKEVKKTKQKQNERAAIDYEMTAGNASQVIPHIGAVASFASGVVFSVLFCFPAHSCTACRQAGRHQVKNKKLNKKEARQR